MQQQQQWHARLIGVGELKRTLWYAGHVFSGRSVRIYHHINGYGYGGQAGWYDASRRSHSRSEPSTPDRPVLVISRAVLACLPLRCAPSRPPTPPPDVGVGSGLVGLASLPLLPGRCDATATATAACVHVTLPCRAAACARSLRSPSPSPPFGPCNTVETRRRTYDTVTPYHASPDCFLVSLRLPGSWAGQPQIKAVKAWVSRQKWQVLVFLKKYR